MQTSVHHATQLLYRTIEDPTRWRDALVATARALSAGHVIVGVGSGAELPRLHCGGIDLSLVENLWPQLADSPFANLVYTLSPEKAYHGATVMPPRTLLGMDFYHCAVKPMEGLHSIIGMPFRTRDTYSFAVACRAPRKGAFGQANLTALQLLLPHLRNALRLGQRLRRAESDAWHRDTALDRLDIGVVVLDRRRRPLLVNARARALAGLNDGLRLTQERFAAADAAANRELQGALDSASDTDEIASSNLCVRVNRPSGRPPFLLRAVPIDDDGELSAEYPRGAVLVFIDTVETDRLQPATLRRWFRLSAREAELATLLVDGHSLAECASAMRVSIETVRTHLDGLFAKTRTRRQVELVSALLRAAWRL